MRAMRNLLQSLAIARNAQCAKVALSATKKITRGAIFSTVFWILSNYYADVFLAQIARRLLRLSIAFVSASGDGVGASARTASARAQRKAAMACARAGASAALLGLAAVTIYVFSHSDLERILF